MSPTQETGASHTLKEEGMTRTLLTVLALAGVAACGGGERQDLATADSLSRDLQLAPVDTTAVLNDAPAPTTEEPAPAASPAPAPAAPAPRPATPKPAAPQPAAPKPTPAPAAAPAPAPAPALAAGTAITA